MSEQLLSKPDLSNLPHPLTQAPINTAYDLARQKNTQNIIDSLRRSITNDTLEEAITRAISEEKTVASLELPTELDSINMKRLKYKEVRTFCREVKVRLKETPIVKGVTFISSTADSNSYIRISLNSPYSLISRLKRVISRIFPFAREMLNEKIKDKFTKSPTSISLVDNRSHYELREKFKVVAKKIHQAAPALKEKGFLNSQGNDEQYDATMNEFSTVMDGIDYALQLSSKDVINSAPLRHAYRSLEQIAVVFQKLALPHVQNKETLKSLETSFKAAIEDLNCSLQESLHKTTESAQAILSVLAAQQKDAALYRALQAKTGPAQHPK